MTALVEAAPALPAGDAPAKKKIKQSFAVPDRCVGFLIGKGGVGIKKLNEESRCDIVVTETTFERYNENWRYVTLCGKPSDIYVAKMLIWLRMDRVEEMNSYSSSSDESIDEEEKKKKNNKKASEDQLVVQQTLPVPEEMVGYLIGKSGKGMQSLRAKSGTTWMNITDEDPWLKYGVKWRCLKMRGTPDQINTAKMLTYLRFMRFKKLKSASSSSSSESEGGAAA